jgi:hypothetical protein
VLALLPPNTNPINPCPVTVKTNPEAEARGGIINRIGRASPLPAAQGVVPLNCAPCRVGLAIDVEFFVHGLQFFYVRLSHLEHSELANDPHIHAPCISERCIKYGDSLPYQEVLFFSFNLWAS